MSYRRILILVLILTATAGGSFYLGSRYFAAPIEKSWGEEQTREIGLKVEPRVLDLGKVIMNRPMDFAAMIHNYGKEPRKLVRIQPSCGGCTNVSVTKQIIEPGDYAELKGTLTARKPGRFLYLVKVFEEDKLAPELVLEVQGEAEASISAFPETILLNPSVFENKAAEQVVLIRNNSDERAIIRKPIGLPAGISVQIMKSEIEPKQESKVIVRAEPLIFLDTDLNLSFPTNHSRQDNVAVIVQMRPENGFTVVPNRIRLGIISKRELERSPIRLSLVGPGVKNLTIKQIISPSFLKLAKESTRRDNRLEMEFNFNQSLQGTNLQGTIRIDLDVNAQGSEQKSTLALNVPISGLVRD